MTSALHRVTLLPDGVNVSDYLPVTKRSKECYDIVSPCHIPSIKLSLLIEDDEEQLAIKIPTAVLDKIPMLKDFKQLAVGQDLDPSNADPVATSGAAGSAHTAETLNGGTPSAECPDKSSQCNTGSGDSNSSSQVEATFPRVDAAAHDAGAVPAAHNSPPADTSFESNSAVLQLPGGSWGLLVMLKVLLDRHVDLDRVLLVDAIEPAGAAALAVCPSLLLCMVMKACRSPVVHGEAPTHPASRCMRVC